MDLDILKQRAKAFDYLFDAVVVTDPKGIIIDWNMGAESLYGYSKEEVLGLPVNILHVPEDSELLTNEIMNAIQAQGKWSGEIRMLRKNGHIGWIESICMPILDDCGQMLGALGINRDITERKEESERLEHLAHYDHLTNIPNRYLLLDRVEHLIEQSKRNHLTFALLFIDLDKFKMINDTKGHIFGDKVLVEIALRLKRTIRHSDTVARFGGDEFVILLENISHSHEASKMVQTIGNALNTEFCIDGDVFHMDCSIGCSLYPDEGATAHLLLSAADKAMYREKYNH